ncbi:flavin reductase family protein [Burkholderia contaminans]|uniref:Hybrid-cluster NAD(P)-dependent oxidoreductase n=1 Tax=Burkholderia contaminans TaxID=488447 RepID=A0A3N8PTE6_9BURK|nr:iron-sulfur cluster-binding domain-containing protein [Burkholderia contaminans]RQT14892.1 hybrid-cluster NAD(P)-dependent oxidoreductase [Burkholderia contaminans]
MTGADRSFAPVRCESVVRETHDVKTFTWCFVDGRRFSHEAGQHVTFEVPLDDGPRFRCYTVASSRHDAAAAFSITVKQAVDGPVSRWLHRRVAPGTVLRVAGPSGTFVAPSLRTPLLMISGGVGITPLISMVRHWRATTHDGGPDAVFVQCVRTPGDVLFHDELVGFAREWASFRIHEVISRAPGGGRLTAAMLSRLAPDAAQRDVYCCGPEPFMRDVRASLLSIGLAAQRYHEESFTLPVISEPAPTRLGDVHQLHFVRSGREARCTGADTVLDAAMSAGLVIPSACRAGVCGTCRVRLHAGTVDMTDAGGIGDDDIAAGYVLACCSRPTSDLQLDV